MSDGFPLDLETLLASIVEVLKQNGNAREIAILVDAEARTEAEDYDHGVQDWGLVLAIDLRFHSTLKETTEPATPPTDGGYGRRGYGRSGYQSEPQSDIEKAAEIIRKAGQGFFSMFPTDNLTAVRIVPRPVVNQEWRIQAKEYLSGKGITNQGRVRSDNPASLQREGLLFRSKPEINLYLAIKSAGVTLAPLPVFVRGGASYSRLEPDFVLIKDGVMMVVEVDGPYHRESPADAHARLQPLDHEGAKIERVKAEECDTPEKAKACADRLMQILQKRIAQRG